MRQRAILFDIDQTLLLKKPSTTEMVLETVLHYDPAVTMEAVQQAYAASELWQGEQIRKENETGVRMPDEEYIAHVAQVYGQALQLRPDAVQELIRLFTQGYESEYILAPGAWEVLESLKAEGVLLGIVSNNHAKIRQVLDDMGILDFFGTVIISEEVDLYKPDAAILKLACRQLGAAPEACLYVGDHPFDILCAHDAGMPVVWLPVNRFMKTPDYVGIPEYTAESLKDALKFIKTNHEKG